MLKTNLSDIFSDLNTESSVILPKSIKIKNIKGLDTISDATSSFMPQKGGYLNGTKNKDINQLISMLSATSDDNYTANSTDTEQLKHKLFNIIQSGGVYSNNDKAYAHTIIEKMHDAYKDKNLPLLKSIIISIRDIGMVYYILVSDDVYNDDLYVTVKEKEIFRNIRLIISEKDKWDYVDKIIKEMHAAYKKDDDLKALHKIITDQSISDIPIVYKILKEYIGYDKLDVSDEQREIYKKIRLIISEKYNWYYADKIIEQMHDAYKDKNLPLLKSIIISIRDIGMVNNILVTDDTYNKLYLTDEENKIYDKIRFIIHEKDMWVYADKIIKEMHAAYKKDDDHKALHKIITDQSISNIPIVYKILNEYIGYDKLDVSDEQREIYEKIRLIIREKYKWDYADKIIEQMHAAYEKDDDHKTLHTIINKISINDIELVKNILVSYVGYDDLGVTDEKKNIYRKISYIMIEEHEFWKKDIS